MPIIKNKYLKAFTLFELMVVIAIISIVYGFVAFSFNVSSQEKSISLINIKSKLLTYDFENELSLKCVKKEPKCFLYLDGQISQDVIKLDLNLDYLEVYNYSDKLERLYFKDIEPYDFENYEVIFSLTLDNDKKHKDLIVKNGEDVYIFNSLFTSPLKLASMSEVSSYFNNKIQEVRDSAF